MIAYLKKKDDKGVEIFHANVRKTPNGEVAGTLDPGARFHLTGEEKATATITWVKGEVSTKKGIVGGWVSKKLLNIECRPPPPAQKSVVVEVDVVHSPIKWWEIVLAAVVVAATAAAAIYFLV